MGAFPGWLGPVLLGSGGLLALAIVWLVLPLVRAPDRKLTHDSDLPA